MLRTFCPRLKRGLGGSSPRSQQSLTGDQALVGEHLADLVHARVLRWKDQVRRFQGVGGQRRAVGADLVEQAVQRRGEGRLVVAVDGRLELTVHAVQLRGARVVDGVLALAADPDDHGPSPSCGSAGRSAAGMLAGWVCPWGAWLLPLAPPSSCLGAPDVISPLSLLSSLSTSLLADIMSSSLWMSSRLPPTASSSAPEAISSSMAPARACIWAVLSSARWIAMPTSPISSEMPENASLILVWASAAV